MISRTPATISGRGSVRRLRDIFAEKAVRKPFLVTGRESYRRSGAEAALGEAIDTTPAVTFNDISSNLSFEDVETAVETCRTEQCDFVVGVGGGSVMDLAKAVSILATQPSSPSDCICGHAPMSPRQIGSVMIPTTAGSGSEATHFSVIYVDGVKHSLADASMLSDYALLDASLTDSLTPTVTACSGLDALSQAIESFWSIRSTEISREKSKRAMSIALDNLVMAVTDPTEIVRDNMLRAAHLAGEAINVARTTAAHAASYFLTTRHGVPHGQAVALILPHLLAYNARHVADNCCDPRGPLFVRERLDELYGLVQVEDAAAARDRLTEMVRQVGLESRLSAVGVAENELDDMAAEGLRSDRAGNNPVGLDRDGLRSILREAL